MNVMYYNIHIYVCDSKHIMNIVATYKAALMYNSHSIISSYRYMH